MRLPISVPPVVLFVALLFLPAQTRSSQPVDPAGGDPHDFLVRHHLECRDCHASVGIKSRGVMRKSIDDICAGCHKLPGHSHPVDIEPAFLVPADLPLDVRGMLTCATCHDPHRAFVNSATGERTMYLRRDGTRKQFCDACHLHKT